MLDYAANAVVTWEVEKIRSAFERRCRREEKVPEKELFNLLGNEKNIDEFWLQVKTNLRAGRIRIIFLADSIPAELRRIVEFLNAQMDPAEVLAIEVKQFTSVNSGMKTYVPRVFGQTETARQNKLRGTKTGIQWNEATFMAALEDRSGAASRQVAENILLWIKPLVTCLRWGKGSQNGGVNANITNGETQYTVCRIVTGSKFVFRFDWLVEKKPFDKETVRRQLLAKINEIPGVVFEENVLTTRARIPLEKLTSEEALEKLKLAVYWLIGQIEEQARLVQISDNQASNVDVSPASSIQDDALLPISFDPTDPNEFKTQLLRKKVATIEIHYCDGRKIKKKWTASKFTLTSNLIGNLRSRPDFRAGNWQEKGISHIHLIIDQEKQEQSGS